MNDKTFKDVHGQYGTFTLFKVDSQWMKNYCCVKTICRVDAPTITESVNKLMAVHMAFANVETSHNYSVKSRKITVKGLKRKLMEISTIIYVRNPSNPINTWSGAEEVLNWLKANSSETVEVDVDSNFNTDKLSVGPCAYQDDKYRYIKVRFDGMSVPVYFNKTCILTDKTIEMLAPLSGPALSIKIMEVINNHSTTILERANERPLNLSGIAEYATHKLSYWIQNPSTPSIYHLIKPESHLLKVPGTKVYPLCYYGYNWKSQTTFAYILIDDAFYRVDGFHNRRYGNDQKKFSFETFDVDDYQSQLTTCIYGDNVYFTTKELKTVPEADTFVREKALRTLKAKI